MPNSTYNRRKALGLCVDCGDQAHPKKVHCSKCVDKHIAYMVIRKADAVATGKCNVCYARPARERRKRCDRCAERHLRHDRDDYLRRRLRVIAMYGGSCVCCGQTNRKYLQIDHVNDDGCIERKLTKSLKQNRTIEFGKAFYTKLGKSKRRSDLQLLCANCHNAKTRYGGCTVDDHPIVQVVVSSRRYGSKPLAEDKELQRIWIDRILAADEVQTVAVGTYPRPKHLHS